MIWWSVPTVVVLQGEWSVEAGRGGGGGGGELWQRPVVRPKGCVWSWDRRGKEALGKWRADWARKKQAHGLSLPNFIHFSFLFSFYLY